MDRRQSAIFPARRLDRRSMLRTTASAAAAVLVPCRVIAAEAVSATMATLSAYMGGAGARALPDAVTEQAKLHVLDTFAAMISGSTLPPGHAAFQFARAEDADPTATIVAARMTAGPADAALVNAMLAQSDETDDSNEFSQSHPGCSIVPAALAAGERFGAGGTRFLRAVALGYDVGARMTISFGAVDFRNNSHKSTHAIAGCFGSAAAAGCLAGLDAGKMRWLLDYTAQQAAGIGAWTRDTQHIEKAFVFAGMPARNGLTSALLVQAGFTGIADIFSGADNYFLATAPNADMTKLVEALGERYEIVRTNIKKWSVGSPIQAPLDAIDDILRKRPIKPEEVKTVVVRIANTEARVVDDRAIPDISLQHMVAVMLQDGIVSFRAAHDKARMADPAILRTRAKVQLVPSAELERLEPARQAIVEIMLNDGTVLSDRVTAVRGTAENPMPRDEVVRKCRDLVEPVLGQATCTGLIEKVLALDTIKDIRELRGVLQPA